ncbi:GNAT family N-acetyltransferase [Pseudomonas sp. WS 5059]|uniref:GNAT family N-acetyltransferase n=2 Tax=Pseudomonas TaxID=286 RepID=A0A7Y1MTX7_9PSED|nr:MULTISPECIES: GNAT family N-acetyltransferase [Pseudomonas]MBN0979874.1 GNAT family N-acetyltransferase [Pseudomonas hygromyciniae]MRU54101.1 GNAT family N-acetyltransferase [Pseudomonas gessardii]NMX36075.1 GNAT family N-acetyltransferase [Pseudomonas sp. WS 5413]NMY06739.1 GNAT family N-acetyltransferase [Pseudomonas sp. WS 5059]NMY29845.1 GNAT family N-acetyltransferase [Pseudomonas sp. WS 5021]
MSMTDPLAALVSLQVEVRKGMPTHPAENYQSVRVVADKKNGRVRYTYARVEHGRVKAMSMFVSVDPIDGIACFQIGYAVPEVYRGRGWATEIVVQGLEELRNGLARHGVKQFYIEAVVGTSNLASIKVATKTISQSPELTTDSVSGEAALAFTRLIEC